VSAPPCVVPAKARRHDLDTSLEHESCHDSLEHESCHDSLERVMSKRAQRQRQHLRGDQAGELAGYAV